MLNLILILGALFIGLPLIFFVFKLILGVLGITLGLVSLPILLVGLVVFLPIIIIFGLLTKLLPLFVVVGLGFLAYRYLKNREYY